MKYLELWTKDKFLQKSYQLEKTIEVEGIRDKHLGPRFEYAKILVQIEPFNELDVILLNTDSMEDYQIEMLEASIFGLLDILLTKAPCPLKDVRITLKEFDIDPIDSSLIAFRYAGRNAGEKILDILKTY